LFFLKQRFAAVKSTCETAITLYINKSCYALLIFSQNYDLNTKFSNLLATAAFTLLVLFFNNYASSELQAQKVPESNQFKSISKTVWSLLL
jgi:hypothetical protein